MKIYEIEKYIGKKIGKWTVTEYVGKRHNSQCVRCICNECGNEIILPLIQLIHEKDHVCIKCKANNNYKNTRLYSAWSRIRYAARTSNLPICTEWANNFFLFAKWSYENGYDHNLPSWECTFTKLTKDLGYIPSNCKWTTRSEHQIYAEKDVSNTKSKYAGIIARDDTYKSKWFARVDKDGKQIFLKSYKTIEEAVKARNEYIIENNLPHKIQTYKSTPKEIWRDVVGYEGLYEVSSFGRVRSLIRDNKILNYEQSCRFNRVDLYNGKTKKKKHVALLVAEAFIPNPDHFEKVIHKNKNKRDDRVENLRWYTHY